MTRDLARESITAIFENSSDAENALRELRDDGFSADRLGCATGSSTYGSGISTDRADTSARHDSTAQHESFWQKVEDFFSGNEGYEDRNTGAGDGTRETGPVVDRTLTIPDRYRDRLNSACTMVAVYGSDRLDRAEQILVSNDGEIQRNFDEHQREYAGSAAGTNATEREGGRIQLLSERLYVNKQRVNAGEVRLRKEVVTEQQNIQVPVTREELIVERVPVEGQTATGEIGSNQEIRVPLTEERVEVEKRPVVREEVRVGKRAVEETRDVTDSTRREELKVEKSGNVRGGENLEDIDANDPDVKRRRTA